MTRGFATAVAIASSVGAGVIHLALGPEHLEELGLLGWGFYLAAALQIGWAVAAAAVRGDPRLPQVAVAGIAINLAILGAWFVSRTIGLPTADGPLVAEAIGRVDTITAALEVATVAVLVAHLRIRATTVARGGRLKPVLAILVIAAGTAVALLPDPMHAEGHAATSHEAMHQAESAR